MFSTVFVLVTLVSVTGCAKILCAFPVPSVSHLAIHQTIAKELSLRGHQVTVLTARPLDDKNLTNLTEVRIDSLLEITSKNYKRIRIMSKESYELQLWSFFGSYYADLVEEMITHMTLNQTDFDLVIVEALHPLVYSLGCRFRVPIIAVSSSILTRFAFDTLGNTQHPLLYFEMKNNLDTGISIYEKTRRLVNSVVSRVYHHWFVIPEMNKRTKKLFGTCPFIEDIQKNVSLLLAATSPVLNSVQATAPVFKQVGSTLHIRPKKPLPQDLQSYLDQNAQGVVYFSLGSAVRISVLSESFIKGVVQALAELPYNVLLKWETDNLPDKPDNVMIRKWFPQQDILSHENIKVFVTQGGLQSIKEAVANGVPLVGIPFFVDQPFNVVQLMKLGIARGLDYNSVTKDSLKEAIMEVAGDEKYRRRVEEVRKLTRDQTMQSLDQAIWWVEYVLRRKGAKHLKSLSADLSWSDYLMLDVIGVVVLIPTVVYALYIVFKK